MIGERGVMFPAPGGESLSGILHEPAAPRAPRVGIQLLNPGIKSRVAPNRLNVRLARLLAAHGYHVLRFDPPGIGDSGGDLPEETLVGLWHSIQKGLFVGPALAANHIFAEECGLDEIVAIGNCGGAITALLLAELDPRVRRIVLMSIPVTLIDTDPDAAGRIRDAGLAAKVLRSYARRTRDWRAWLRLVSMRSDYGTIAQALRVRLSRRPPKRQWSLATEAAGAPSGGAGPDDETWLNPGGRLSPSFLRALGALGRRSGRALFVNAERDPSTALFDSLFAPVHLAPGSARAREHPVVVIPEANHVYGCPEWFDLLSRTIVTWLETGEAPLGSLGAK